MEKRDLYIEKVKAQIEQYNAKLALMRGKASEISADMKLEYIKQMEKLEGNRDELKEKYEQLMKSTESTWEELKEGTEKVWNELKDSVSKAAERFKK